MEINKIAIIGLGLIGGSIGLGLKRTCPDIRICGIDIAEETLDKGIDLGVIDEKSIDLSEGVKDADVVIISTLASSVIKVINEIKFHLKPGAIVTDVASTKAKIVEKVESILPEGIFYIGGHPMAGSEKQGVTGADPYLLENAVYVLTPTQKTDKNALAALGSLAEKIGSRVIYLSPEEHDRKVAGISHLPHIVASSLMNTVGILENENPGFFRLAAGGFRDVTRIADSQSEMWRDIFLENKKQVLDLVQNFKVSLEKIEKAILSEEETDLVDFLEKARKWREEVPKSSKGLLPEIYDVVVTVPDQPGIIGKLANVLGKENINIMDIEILRVREGEGEVLRFGFRQNKEALDAVEVIKREGYLARLRT